MNPRLRTDTGCMLRPHPTFANYETNETPTAGSACGFQVRVFKNRVVSTDDCQLSPNHFDAILHAAGGSANDWMPREASLCLGFKKIFAAVAPESHRQFGDSKSGCNSCDSQGDQRSRAWDGRFAAGEAGGVKRLEHVVRRGC